MLKKNRVRFLGCQALTAFFVYASLYFILRVVKSIYLGFGSIRCQPHIFARAIFS